MSYHQERIWFINEFEKGKLYDSEPTYHNIPLIFKIKGTFDIAILEEVAKLIVCKHKVLRIQVIQNDESVKLKPSKNTDFDASREEVPCIDNLESSPGVLNFIFKPFNLENDIPVRLKIFTCNGSALVCFVFHHLIIDRPSIKEIYSELLELYRAATNEGKKSVNALYLQFADFITWQNKLSDTLKRGVHGYWKQQIGQKYEPIELPTDSAREGIHIFSPGMHKIQIEKPIYDRIINYAKQEGILTRSILSGLFNLTLHKHSNQDGLLIGTFIPNRPVGTKLIGPAANLFPILSTLSGQQSLTEFIKSTELFYQNALSYSQYPFDLLVKELNMEKDMSRTALFDILFYFDETCVPDVTIQQAEFSYCEANLGYGKYDINTLVYVNSNGGLDCIVIYNELYYNINTIQNLVSNYAFLISSFDQKKNANASEIELITEEQKSKIFLTDIENTVCDMDIITCWEQQVDLYSSRVAVSFSGRELSYLSLDILSTNIAATLYKKYGVREGDYVVVMLANSELLIAVLLGILKCGAAYVPLDVDSPVERVNYIINDISSWTVICEEGNDKSINNQVIKITIDDITSTCDCSDWKSYKKPDNNAYVIYTSGTTGHPKGCIVTHKNVVSLIKNKNLPFDFNCNDVWLLAHSYSFDFSVWEIFGALLWGGRLVVPGRHYLTNLSLMRELVHDTGVTILNQTPSVFKAFIEVEKEQSDYNLDSHLRMIVFGGEYLDCRMLKDWVEMYDIERIMLVNMYGITETTVHTTYHKVSKKDISSSESNVGRPLPGTKVYLFDKRMVQVPVNVIGEIYVEGNGVIQGYLNKPELTLDRFYYHSRDNIRLYKSGDMAKWTTDGQLIYIGRMDLEVKIRGYRIALPEIENILRSFENVKDVAVHTREDTSSGKYLVAYIVYNGDLESNYSLLKEKLHLFLPDYMIPAHFIQVGTIPLTVNKKTDYKLLANIDINSGVRDPKGKSEYASNDVERQLIAIWSKILKVPTEKIGINDNFFDLGGQSITVVFLANEIKKVFYCEVPIKDIFICNSLKKLADCIINKGSEDIPMLVKAISKSYYPTSHAQRAIFIAQVKNKMSTAYNMPHLIRVAPNVDIGRAISSLRNVVKRHESFFTNFDVIDKQIVQIVRHPYDIPIDLLEYDFSISYERIKELVRPFDLSNDCLIRCLLINDADKQRFLFLDFHHIICDALSINILTEEFILNYKGSILNEVKFQYKDYCEYLNGDFFREQLNSQRKFWLDMWSDTDINNLNAHIRPSLERQEFNGLFQHFVLDEKRTELIKCYSNKKKSTVFAVLYALFNLLLSKISNKQTITIGVPLLGRNHPDTMRVVGCFANLVLVKTQVNNNMSFDSFVESVSSNIRNVQDNQDYSIEQIKHDIPELIAEINDSCLVAFQLLDSNEFPVLLNDDFCVVKDVILNNTYKYDLFLNCVLTNSYLEIDVMLNEAKYDKGFINDVMNEYINCVDYFLENSNAKISAFNVAIMSKVTSDLLSDLSQGFDL